MEHDARVSTPSPPRTLQEEILSGEPLTKREIEVLAGVAAGDTANKAGQRMFLAEATIKAHRKRVIAKLAARNAANAVYLGMRQGLID